MKAISLAHPGGSDMLRLVEMVTPQPQPHELLIEVKAAAVNRTDIMWRENRSLKPPYPILGVEVAGVVVASQDSRFPEGSRVCGLVNLGGYAEYAVMPANRAIPIPENLSFIEAAGIPEVFLTAYQTLYWLGALKAGEQVLIHAGASGVGTAAIQLAKQTGAKVFVTAGSEEKLTFCRQLGADVTINYHEEDFALRIAEATQGAGVDVLLDLVGASYFEQNLASMALDGRWILIGMVGGTQVSHLDLGALISQRIQLIGTLLTPRSDTYKARLTQEFIQETLPLLAKGTVKPIIDRAFPLSEVQAAHQHMEANRNIGKIVLTID